MVIDMKIRINGVKFKDNSKYTEVVDIFKGYKVK
nr:MAG TPA: hypothetical protein [Caudoviricetes sp.]